MKTVAYIRVSTGNQDFNSQKLAILDYAQKSEITVNEILQFKASTRSINSRIQIEQIIMSLSEGDQLIVSELSRLARSLSQIVKIVDKLTNQKIRFIAIKENIRLDGKQNIQTKVMIALFGLFAEVERDLISERTKEGLASARAKGKLLGRPMGSFGKSRLEGKEDEIKSFLSKEVSKSSIAKIMGISRTALYSFIQSRKLA